MVCASCQSPNPDGARFCAFCGTPLTTSRLTDGERKYATVVFADVAGSTALSERLDPEDWAEIMNGAFAFMNAAVTSYGGTVGRLMGDAVLAFFGAPQALEDHAARAVHAAFAIQEAAASYAATLARDYGIEFRVRVGIATGLVVFATVGDSAKTEYTAMGDSANLAARLQAMAAPGGILIAGETEALVRDAFETRRVDGDRVRGKAEAVEVFEVVAPRARQAASARDARIGGPLIARDVELDGIVASIRRAREGRGAFLLLVGDAGVGKSRLLAEARRRTEEAGSSFNWIEGRAVSFGQAASYHAWQTALRQMLGAGVDAGVTGAADSSAARPAVRDRLERWGLEAKHRPFVERMLGLESVIPDDDAPSPDEAMERVGQAVRAVLELAAQAAPTVLVLEDLHWADGVSVDLLASVADLVTVAPLVIVAAMRPERAAPVWRLKARLPDKLGDAFREVDLAPLGAGDSEAMLASLAPGRALPPETRRMIVQRSDGNPFFLEEIVRDLIDSGHLIQEDGAWRLAREVRDVDVPETLLGVLTARIDRLPDVTKRVAQTAAVIGRTFTGSVLTGVCASAPPPEQVAEVEPHVRALAREDMVREIAGDAEEVYRFKHALSQEAAYAGLLLRRRKRLHRSTAEVLEKLYGDDRDAHAAELAYHSWRADDWQRAARYASLAGTQAMRMYAVTEALQHFTNAVEALERTEDADAESAIEATLGWVIASTLTMKHESPGPRQAMIERLEKAERRARTLDDRSLLARVLVHKGNVLALSGFPESAYPALEEASDLATDLENEPLFLLPFYYATERMVDLDPRKAAEQFDEIIAAARRHRNKGFEAHAHAVKAMALARLGEREAALEEVQTALAMGPQSGSRIKEADVNIVAGIVFLELGEPERAAALSELGARQALDVGGMQCACGGYFVHGMSQLAAERLGPASSSFQASVNFGASSEMQTLVNLSSAGHAITRLAQGDAAAVADLEAALQNAHELRDRYGAAFLARELGKHYLQQGDHARAAELLLDALEYYRGADMRPDILRTLEPATRALALSGRSREADDIQRELGRPPAADDALPGASPSRDRA